MDPGWPQQQDKKQLLQQQQLLLQKQLQQQHQQQQLLKQQQQLNIQQQQFKQQQQQQLKPQQQLLQTQQNSQQQQQVLQAQPQYLQQQLSPNQQQLLIRNQDFLKQRGIHQGNLNQQQLLEHQTNQDQAIIELLQLHDNNEYDDKNLDDCYIVEPQEVIQQQQQPSVQRQQPLLQQSHLGQQLQHQQQQQFLQQSQQQLQTVQQPQLITQPQSVPKTQVERQPQVVRHPHPVQKPNLLQQSQNVQQQNNQYSPVSTQQQSKKQPPPHTQQLLQQQLQQLLLKNKNYPQRIVVLGNQPQQQQLSSQQPQRVVTNNGTGKQTQQMQCVVVTGTGQQPQQMQRVVVTGTGQQQQQQQVQRVMVGNNGQQQPQQMPQQMQRVVVPTTATHQQMQRVVVTSTGQQIQQQQLQHVVIPGTNQQQSHQVHNVVTQTSIQQQPQQLQRVVVAPTGQQQVQRVVTSTSGQQQQQQHQPVPQRIVIGQLKTSQQTQQMESPSQNGVVLNQQVIQRPIGSKQQQQRVVIAGQQQILKLTNQQQSQQQITLQKQLAHKLLQPTSQQQQQDVVKNQQQPQQLDVVKNHQQQQDVVKIQQQHLDVINNQHQQDVLKKQQQQQDVIKKQQHFVKKQLLQVPHQQLPQSTVVPLTQQQKNNIELSNESLSKELHIKQSHQQLQQLHIQPSQKHSQEQINKQLQQQKLKQKKEIDQLQHQLKQPQRSGVIVGQLQQPEKPEPEKLKKQLEIQQQQRQKLQERILLQQRQQQQQQQQKLKEQQLQQKHQQQLREQVLLQQHLKQQHQQQLQKKLLLRQQASSENSFSLVVNGIQDQKIQDEDKTTNRYEKSQEPEHSRYLEKATAAEKQYQPDIIQKNNDVPVSEKELLSSSSSSDDDDDDDDDTIRKQRSLLREAERLVQERYDALTGVLGSEYQAQYDDILRNWLANRLSREEFDREIRKVMYVSWVDMMKHVDGDHNRKNETVKTKTTSTSKKSAKKKAVATLSKIKEDTDSLINSTAHKSPTLKQVAEVNEDIDINIEKKEAKAILAERVPLHNALVTSLIMWLPLNCQWLEQRKARSQGLSETGSPLRLYTYADVPQVRGPSDHWYPDVPGSLARWYWPNHLPCKSSLAENNKNLSLIKSFREQEKIEVADAVAAAVLIKPPSRILLPLLMEVAENTETVRRARQIQYQKKFPKKQNAKVMKKLQWQRLQEQKRLATKIQLRDGCSKLLRELKIRLRYLANQEGRLIERLRRLQIRMSRRRRQVLAQFKIREQDLQSRVRKFFDRSYLGQTKNDSHKHFCTDSSNLEDDDTDKDEKDNEKKLQYNFLKQNRKEIHLSKKNHEKNKRLKTTIADHQSRLNVRAQPQSTALTIRLLRDRQRFLATTRLLQVTKQERLQIRSYADYVRDVRNKNCPCGESDNKPCQFRRQIRQLRKKLRARELATVKEEIDRELVKKAAEKEKLDAEELQKTAAIEIEKKKTETPPKKVGTKSTKKKKVAVTRKNINVETAEKKTLSNSKSKTVDNNPTKTNTTVNNSTSKKKAPLVTTNTKNAGTKVQQTLDNLEKVNKGKHDIGINCELFQNKSPQQTQHDSLGDTRNRIRPPIPKDKRSMVNVADAAARAAQAALAASKKTQLRKTRAAAAAAAAATAAAAAAAATASTAGTMPSGKFDNDRRASELMPPPPPPPLQPTASPKAATTPRNPTIGARYLQQQQLLLDRHRQLERIRRDEEERRQRAQDERQLKEQEYSDKEEDETNIKTDDVSNVSSLHLPPSQQMRSKRQKVLVDAIRQDKSREDNNDDQEDFSHVNRRKAKNIEEGRQLNDYYFYYGGADYYSSDEESSGSSFIEPPFPPLLHDLRIDQLPRPSNRVPAAAVLPPGVRTQPMRLSSSKIQDSESSASYRKPQAEKKLQERKIIETGHGRNINEQVQSFDRATEFSMHSNPLNTQTMTDKSKTTKSVESPPSKKLITKIRNKLSKGLQTDLEERPGQQPMQHERINDTKMSPVQRKRRQDAKELPVAKKLIEEVHQERQKNAESILKANPLTEWSKRDLKQVTITSVTKTNSLMKDQPKYLVSQLKQQNPINKIKRSVSSNKGQEPDTKVDVEELRSVQWKAPLTQWNKRPVAYEAAIKQRPRIQNKGNDLQHSMKEKAVTCTSAKFEVSKHHPNDRQHKLRSEIDRQKCERIKLQNMVFEYQKLVDTLPLNVQLQHMIRLQQHLRPSGNIIEKTTVQCNPSVKQQLQSAPSTYNSRILLDDSTSLQISNLLLKIKHQREEMYRNVVISNDIKCSSKVVPNKLDVNNVEQNDLKNWHDLWPAFEDKPNNVDLMDEEQRLHRTQELIYKYYSSNNDQKLIRSSDQQKRRLGRYGRERLERELPEYQNLRTKQIMQPGTSARSNIAEPQITIKRQKLQHTQQHLPERQIRLDQYKRLGRIEQLEQQKHILGYQQQQLKEQKIKKLKNSQQKNSPVGRDFIQQQRPRYCWTVGKFRVSPTLCYSEQLPLLEQLLRRIIKKKNVGIIKINGQQQHPKSTTIPVTATSPMIIMPEDTSNVRTTIQSSRGSQLWWMNIGLERQISPLVLGVDNQADPELTPIAMMPIGNLPQVTRPQTDTKAASVIYIHQKSNTIFTNKKKLQKLMTPQLLKMMTDVEERWLEQLQTKISQLDQQVDLHWKTMMDRQQQQVKLLLNYDKHLQLEKEKKRLERERRIQQLRKRTPFKSLPVHHQQAHTSRVVGHTRQQSEIPIIIIDDDDKPLNDTTVVGQKMNKHPHPVFIDDDLLKHKIETKVLYEDQHKGVSNRWMQLEIRRKEHEKQWKLKIRNLFSYKATNRQFCRELYERLMNKINNPILITALERLNGEKFRYTKRQQFQKQVQPSESWPVQEQPRMLNRQKEAPQKQALKNRSHQTLTEQKQLKTVMLSKKSKKMTKQQRSTLQLASQQRPLNKKGDQKLTNKLLQNLNDPNKNQAKPFYEHQETANVRQLRSKRTIVVNQPSQKQAKQQNNQNQNKRQIQKKSPVEQEKQTTQRRIQRGKMLTKVKTPAVSSRHIFLLRNRILKVHSNRKKRLQKQIKPLVPKQDVIFDAREMQVQQYEGRNKSIKLTLRSLTYSLYNQRSMLQRQLDRLNETHPDKIDKQLEPSVSKTIIMSVHQPSITSLILPPLQPLTIKKQSLTSTVILSPERPLPSIEPSSSSSVMLTSQLPMQPNIPFVSTSAVFQPCQENQQVEEKRHTLKQQLNFVHSKLKPLMEMWQLSLRMPGRWLCQQLDDIEQLKRKELTVKSMLDLGRPSGRQHTFQNNEVSVSMASTSMNQCSLQQLQRIRDHLNWRQQRLRDLIEDLLILICPEQHPMLSVITREPSNCSVLIKLQQRPPTVEQINPTYSALLNLQSPSSSKQMQQQFSTYSLLLKLKQPITAKQQSLMYSTLLKLQQPQPLMSKQTSCRSMMIATQQPSTSKQQRSIDLVSGNLIHNPKTSNNKLTHGPNYQLQEKRPLSSENENDDACKRLKSSSRKRPKSPLNSISSKRSVPYSLTKNTGIDKNLPIINLVDSDDDIETINTDSSTELSNEASFGVQVSEKSPLTIKIIKKKPLTQHMITDMANKSEINDMNSVLQFNENINNIDLNKDLDKTRNEYVKENNVLQIEDKGEHFKTLIPTKDENNKKLICEQEYNTGKMIKTLGHTTIFSRPTQIAVLVNKPNKVLITNDPSLQPSMAVGSNQILKVAVVECTTSMISNDSKCIKVVPGGRSTRQLTGSVKNPTYVNSVDRTISVISKLTEAAVDIIKKTPTPIPLVHQPAIGYIPKLMITPIVKSNMKMKNSMNKCQSNSNKTENTKNLIKSKIITIDNRRRTGILSKTVRRYRRLNRTLSLETRGPAVPTFRDHGFAQGTIEQVVHGRFVTTIMTMSAAYTIASYLPPRSPRIPLDYASLYQHNVNMAHTAVGNSNSNVDNNQNNKSSKTPVTLSAVMGGIEKAVKYSSNIACGNGHVWSGCARTSGPTLMILSKVTKEAISRNTAHQSRSTSSSQLTKALKTPTSIPGRLSRSTRKKPIPVIENSTKRSLSAMVPTSLTSTVTPSSVESMTKSVVSTPLIKKVAGLSSSLPSVGLHNRSKSALVVASASRKQQLKSEVQPTKRSASVAFSSAPLFTSEISTDIVVPALNSKISPSSMEGQPHKRSKSAVTTTNTLNINVSPTFSKPSFREKCHGPVKRSASVAEYVSPSITSKISGSPPAVQPPKRSKSAVVTTPVTEAAAASSNNFKQSSTLKRSASIALSPPSVGQTNKAKSNVITSLLSNKKSTIQTGPTLANTSVPEPRESRTLYNLKTMSPTATSTATPNDVKNNLFNNAVIETSDEDITTHEKTTTISEEEQRTVTVTRTLCPTIPAPMDVTADACTLVTAACEQFIKAMVMERHLKAGRGAGTLQLQRRDAYAAAIAVDDDIRPFPDYCRTPSIGTTIVNPVTPAHGQGENNDVENEPALEQKSIITDSRCNTKSIVMTMDKPDNVNERRTVSKQQSIIVDSKSNNELSVLTVKTVIETQTTSSTTTTINKLQCPTTITTASAKKPRLLRSAVEGTSARTRGTVILKKTRSSASMPETTMPSTGDQLSSDPTATEKRVKSLPPVIAPKKTVKPSSAAGEATVVITKTLPVLAPELLPDATLTIKTSTSTRGFFVERGRPLLRPAFNRRQPFGTLVATCTMAAVESTALNNTYFSDDRDKDSATKAYWPNDNSTNVWGCYFGNQQMLPPVSRLNNFLNTADEPESTKNYDGGDSSGGGDTAHLVPSSELTKPPRGIRKANDNNAQEQVSLAKSRQQLMFMEIASQEQHMQELEQEMKRRIQEYESREPESQEEYYQKFLKLQYGSTNTPPKLSLLRPSPNGHSLMSW